MQLNAAEALSKIHTRESLRSLVTLLESGDAKLRNLALSGFSRFVLNLPVETPEMVTTMAWMKPQGPTPYRSGETDRHSAILGAPEERHSEYVLFWKNWWAEHTELH